MRSKTIAYGFYEHFTELKSKKGIKNGYAEVKEGSDIVATGSYKNDKKIGRWRYFKKDTLQQLYNYNTNTIEHQVNDEKLKYIIDSLKDGDKLIYPSKIGGSYYGFRFLGPLYTIPHQIRKTQGKFPIYFIFHLNQKGTVMNLKIKTINGRNQYMQEVNLSKLNDEQLSFTPAMVNGKAVYSFLVYEGDFVTSSIINASGF
ncbi:MAG: hypothetical protein V4546_08705 [Bacteroidota bacterium]